MAPRILLPALRCVEPAMVNQQARVVELQKVGAVGSFEYN